MADGIDLKEFRALRRDLRAFTPDKQVKKALKLAGELIAADAKARVAPYSRQTPPTIKTRLSKTAIQIRAGGAEVPIAGLLEQGNKGRSGRRAGKEFRHPVFGREVYVNQPMHPYLLAATEANRRGIEALEGRIVAEAFREVGWRGP